MKKPTVGKTFGQKMKDLKQNKEQDLNSIELKQVKLDQVVEQVRAKPNV